jgi:hypothetical protein
MNATTLMLAKVEEYQEEIAAEIDGYNADGEEVAALKLCGEYRRLTGIRCYLEDRAAR